MSTDQDDDLLEDDEFYDDEDDIEDDPGEEIDSLRLISTTALFIIAIISMLTFYFTIPMMIFASMSNPPDAPGPVMYSLFISAVLSVITWLGVKSSISNRQP